MQTSLSGASNRPLIVAFYRELLPTSENLLLSVRNTSREAIRVPRDCADCHPTKAEVPLSRCRAGLDVEPLDPARAKSELDKLVLKRGDIAHRSPSPKGPIPSPHIVTRDAMRKHVQFIRDLAQATDKYLEENL